MASFSYTLVARKELPQNTLKEVITFAQQNPGKLSLATGGAGSGQHVAGVLFKQLAKVDIVEIPYKGAQPAYTDMLGGRVDLFFDNTTTAQPLIEAGRIKPLATSGTRRELSMPQIPTAREAGVDGLEMESWIGIFASAKTPAPVLEHLSRPHQRRTPTRSSWWTKPPVPPQATTATQSTAGSTASAPSQAPPSQPAKASSSKKPATPPSTPGPSPPNKPDYLDRMTGLAGLTGAFRQN
jgi:hypothetical protein